MNTKRLINCGSIALFGLGLISLCVSIHTSRKAKKAIDSVNKAIDNLADKTSVEISDAIIEKAAEKAADKAAANGVEIVRKDINLKVYNTITSAYDKVEDEVRDRLSKTVERDIDMNKLKQSIENKASSAIVSEFMDNLTDYAGPIMSGIMDAVSRKGK